MQNLETMKAELQAAKEAAANALTEKMEMAKMKAELSLLNNEHFQTALVEQKLREESTNKLTELNNQCEAIVNDNKVYSQTLRQDRTWRPSRFYGMGNQFALLSGLLNGMQYSVNEHKELMLAVTGLSEDLIESTLQSIGQLSYFSVNYGEIVEGTPMDVTTLTDQLAIIEHTLGVQIDKSLVKQATADRLVAVAMVKAQKAEAEAELSTTMENYIIK